MKHIYIIIDCSGSIVFDDTTKVGQINDLTKDLISACQTQDSQADIRVICYANEAKVYWQSSTKEVFCDISTDKFDGRSNLGKAYKLIQDIVQSERIAMSDCILVLISDGEATDNFRKSLKDLDKAIRVAISIGNSTRVSEIHSSGEGMYFKGVNNRGNFIEKITEYIL